MYRRTSYHPDIPGSDTISVKSDSGNKTRHESRYKGSCIVRYHILSVHGVETCVSGVATCVSGVGINVVLYNSAVIH